MTFNIARASDSSRCKKRPCKGAVLVKKGEGCNFWKIEINSLEDLVKLTEESGSFEVYRYGSWCPFYQVAYESEPAILIIDANPILD